MVNFTAWKFCNRKTEEKVSLIDGEKPTDILSSWKALVVAFVLLCLFLLFGTIFFPLVEDSEEIPWSWVDGLYFSVVTLTTVGYGDYTPRTTLGMWVCCFYILVGIGMIGVALGIIGSFLMSRQEQLLLQAVEKKRQNKKRYLSPSQWKLVISLLSLLIVIGVGAIVYSFDSGVDGFTQAVFLTVQTVTTVGYGSPTIGTEWCRAFSAGYILISTLVVASSLGTFADVFIERKQEQMAEKILKADFDLEAILAMDQDGDAQIDMAEFLEFMLVRMGKVSQLDINRIKQQFRDLDADGSGVLDKDDIILLKQNLRKQHNIQDTPQV